jgi:hypothetical protein
VPPLFWQLFDEFAWRHRRLRACKSKSAEGAPVRPSAKGERRKKVAAGVGKRKRRNGGAAKGNSLCRFDNLVAKCLGFKISTWTHALMCFKKLVKILIKLYCYDAFCTKYLLRIRISRVAPARPTARDKVRNFIFSNVHVRPLEENNIKLKQTFNINVIMICSFVQKFQKILLIKRVSTLTASSYLNLNILCLKTVRCLSCFHSLFKQPKRD